MIDVIYTFQFDKESLPLAIKRARCSIESLINQDVRIVFVNYSAIDVHDSFSDLKIEYHHKPFIFTVPWNKSILINHTVKYYVKTKYFFLSDIDIVYPPTYIKDMLQAAYDNVIKYTNEVRIVPMVSWLQEEKYSSDYEELKFVKVDKNNPDIPAKGIGLFDTATFKSITGFNEMFSGWGYEDDEYNSRVSHLNSLIIAKNIKTFHLFHSRPKRQKSECLINKNRFEDVIDVINGLPFIKIREADRKILDILSSNKSNWGELYFVKISICIPTYEMCGKGVQYLSKLIDSIAMQSFKEYEIIISDHSKNKDIENYCKQHYDLPIRYYKNKENYGNGPANTNNSLKFANGVYIKTMFQDDYFIDRTALTELYNTIENSKSNWIVCSSQHIDENDITSSDAMCPQWNHNGINNFKEYMRNPYIGSPSRVMWLNNSELKFDEELVHYMDVDMWYRIGNLFGDPIIYNKKYLVTCRRWSGSISSLCGQSNPLNVELEYMKRKYKI